MVVEVDRLGQRWPLHMRSTVCLTGRLAGPGIRRRRRQGGVQRLPGCSRPTPFRAEVTNPKCRITESEGFGTVGRRGVILVRLLVVGLGDATLGGIGQRLEAWKLLAVAVLTIGAIGTDRGRGQLGTAPTRQHGGSQGLCGLGVRSTVLRNSRRLRHNLRHDGGLRVRVRYGSR